MTLGNQSPLHFQASQCIPIEPNLQLMLLLPLPMKLTLPLGVGIPLTFNGQIINLSKNILKLVFDDDILSNISISTISSILFSYLFDRSKQHHPDTEPFFVPLSRGFHLLLLLLLQGCESRSQDLERCRTVSFVKQCVGKNSFKCFNFSQPLSQNSIQHLITS